MGPPEASFSLVCWKKEERKKDIKKKKKEGREREREKKEWMRNRKKEGKVSYVCCTAKGANLKCIQV